MKSLACVVAVVALAGCSSDGQPSPAIGSALEAFSKGFGNGSAPAAPVAQTPPPTMTYQAPPPVGAQAFWTGKGEQVQTVTGRMAWRCVYNYAGQEFALMFDTYCPSSASVR
jgi:hypothetical protein